jgi:hypothetical protein
VLEIVVHDDVIKFLPMRHIPHGVAQPPFDCGIGFGLARAQPRFKRAARRRQDEDGHALRQRRTHLTGSLPIDLENDAVTARKVSLHRRPSGPVVVVEDLRMLEERPLRRQFPKLLDRHEEVLAPLELIRPRCTRGMGDG